MKSYLLASISTLALIGSAAAADMPVRPMTKAPLAPVMAPSWTGPYAGLNVGAIRTRTSTSVDGFGVSWLDRASFRSTDVTLGGQIGYNWQQQNFVFGVEADLNWANARASKAAIGAVLADLSSRLNWYGTLRARAGILLAPPTLLYATGGVAFAGIRNRAIEQSAVAVFDMRTSGTRTGWVVGGGIEHMFTHDMSVKAEALYMDFGHKSTTDSGYTGRFKNNAIVGRLGVNVRW